jgi:hypothetical protein
VNPADADVRLPCGHSKIDPLRRKPLLSSLISNNEHFFKKILMSDNFHIGRSPYRNWREQMEDELELKVWRLAQQACDAGAFVRLVEAAVGSFKRDPGFDPTVRLHASGIGTEGVRVLLDVLKSRDIYAGPNAGCVELRSRLRMHLRDQLQLHLMGSGQATDEMKDDQLGRDMGL